MITITGTIQDATGVPLHATIDFISKSTPQEGGGIIFCNTDARIKSDPTDGTFSITLGAGTYQVIISANGQSTTFNILVPSGTGSATIDTLVTPPRVYNYPSPVLVWDGSAGNIIFAPIASPAAPTYSVIAYAGGNVNIHGAEHFSYWLSFVTADGETNCSPELALEESLTATPNQANQISLPTNVPAGVTAINIWRTYADNGHVYDATNNFPANVGLLATVTPGTASYDDAESTAQFAARVNTDIIPPLYNTTAGVLYSSGGTACAFISNQGLFFPGANFRIKPSVAPQVYNFTTGLWYSLLVTGTLGNEKLGIDSGNPN